MKRILVSVLVGVLLGAGVTHLFWQRHSEREVASLALINDLARAGNATRNLELLEQQRYAAASKIQRVELDASIDSAYRIVANHRPQLAGQSMPNIILAMERSQAYLARVSPESRSRQWLDKVVDDSFADLPEVRKTKSTAAPNSAPEASL